jgi:adenosylcobinamide-GDP ribazoletransferase
MADRSAWVRWWQQHSQKSKLAVKSALSQFFGAIAFYTCLPIPATWALEFQSVARFAPWVGLLIGALLGLLDSGLRWLGTPTLIGSVLIVAVWLWLTGGLHLDGAMDTADGLAVTDPQRRLQAMADSATGAFGAMTAVVILLLKVAALSDISNWRWLALMGAAGWGRWGQQVAIARYAYLKPTGKGAFHKAAIRSMRHTIPGLLLLLGLSLLPVLYSNAGWLSMGLGLGGAIAFSTAAWFNYRLGGHTGDTYGAVVEWTEALLLTVLAIVNEVNV